MTDIAINVAIAIISSGATYWIDRQRAKRTERGHRENSRAQAQEVMQSRVLQLFGEVIAYQAAMDIFHESPSDAAHMNVMNHAAKVQTSHALLSRNQHIKSALGEYVGHALTLNRDEEKETEAQEALMRRIFAKEGQPS